MNALPNQKQKSICWVGMCLACAMVLGCELDRPNFQMNSNSPTPFFGIDLLPRRRTTSINRPPLNEQVVATEAEAIGVSPVENSPRIGRFLKKNMKWDNPSERTVILPLTKVDPNHPIDRGPVGLLP